MIRLLIFAGALMPSLALAQALRGGNETATSLGTAVECAGASLVINEAGKDCDVRIETDGNANMIFSDGGANAVGIGTNSPGATLEVVPGATATYSFLVSSANGSTNELAFDPVNDQFEITAKVGIGSTGPAYALDLYSVSGDSVAVRISSSGAAALMTVLASGNVGIGTTAPGFGLEVQSTSGFRASTTSTAGYGLYLDADGQVGIGTTAPAEELQVVGDVLISEQVAVGTTTLPTGGFKVQAPATQTIAATETVAADACGTIKKITADSAITTSTTDTFTAPADANDSCCMDVINVGATNNITLDANANFNAAADVVLTPCDVIRVCSDGIDWYPIDALVANTCN